MAANKTIISRRLIHRRRAHRRRLSFLHTENLEVQLVKAAHQAHEAIVNGTITTPQTMTVELTQVKRLNERSGGHGGRRSSASRPLPVSRQGERIMHQASVRRASRTRGTNRRLGNRRAVLRTSVTVTMRVSIPWSRTGVQAKCNHDENKAGWEREVEWQGEVQGDGQHCTTGGGPLSVWKHGVREKGGAGREGGGEAAARAMR